jgi:hypothetical protein
MLNDNQQLLIKKIEDWQFETDNEDDFLPPNITTVNTACGLIKDNPEITWASWLSGGEITLYVFGEKENVRFEVDELRVRTIVFDKES